MGIIKEKKVEEEREGQRESARPLTIHVPS